MDGKTALFDMDGTLFDHDYALKRDMLMISSPEEIEKFNLQELDGFWSLEHIPYIKARIELVRKQPGWWKNLPRYEPGWQIFELANEIGFCCKILTKGPKNKPLAWAEKVECIYEHFGEEMPIDIVGKHKGGTYGRVLVDDYPPYVSKWLQHRSRGLVIMPIHSYNSNFKHENVIHYTEDNLPEIKKVLQAAYNRSPEEHWKARF